MKIIKTVTVFDLTGTEPFMTEQSVCCSSGIVYDLTRKDPEGEEKSSSEDSPASIRCSTPFMDESTEEYWPASASSIGTIASIADMTTTNSIGSASLALLFKEPALGIQETHKDFQSAQQDKTPNQSRLSDEHEIFAAQLCFR